MAVRILPTCAVPEMVGVGTLVNFFGGEGGVVGVVGVVGVGAGVVGGGGGGVGPPRHCIVWFLLTLTSLTAPSGASSA
ncbi:MAG TPA: hypothetical protein PKE64_30965 [Anaerolineae bacterium]|nr:hypothetical protein [Anaerolineae bacterium]